MKVFILLAVCLIIVSPLKMRCFWEIEKGHCKDARLRYAFDRNTQKCVPFIFTGCGGNSNRYPTLKRCEKTCMKSMEKTYP